jgi:hypothetical protein
MTGSATTILFQQVLAVTLAATLAGGVPSSVAGQVTGSLSGRVADDSKKPYSDYAAQLRDVASGKIQATAPLDASGQFVFKDVPVSKPYLLELVRTGQSGQKSVVCTSGPYTISADTRVVANARLDCRRVPAAVWVLAAAAGTAGLVAVVTRSTSK